MKTSILARVAALISAATTTFVLMHSLAIYGHPADSAPQTAQVATVATSAAR